MKKLLIIALALFAGSAMAAETKTSVNTSVQSELLDHGSVVSSDPTAGLGLRFDNVVVDGLFVRSNFNTLYTTPLNENLKVRSDFGFGYGNSVGPVAFEVSANRVVNSLLYAGDYNEIRANASYGWVFATVEQGITANVNKDTYVAAGIQHAFGDLTVGGLVSAMRYNDRHVETLDEFNFNNIEVFAKYNVWRNLDVNLTYSDGGRDKLGHDIKNQVVGGFTYRF